MPETPSIAVIIPAFRVATHIGSVLEKMPPSVRYLIVVDDASPDSLQEVLKKSSDKRLIVLRHQVNQGVGAAMKTGFLKAIELGADIVVKIDGDGQMDPRLISQFVEPLLSGRADFTKGNRFRDLDYFKKIPLVRRLGNLAISFLVKIASGYWSVFDPCNGYIALRVETLKSMNFKRLADRYFFEITMLCEAYFVRAILQDIPMKPIYAGEPSSLNASKILFEFPPKLLSRTFYRILMSYFLIDFNVVSLFFLTGLPLFLFGVAWSAFHWMTSIQSHVFASTGTVMIGALSIILGFQLLLQAVVLDVQKEPGKFVGL